MDILDEKFVVTAFIARLEVQLKDLMFSISKNLRQAWLRSSPKQRSISTVKKPSCPSKEALLLKRKRAREIKKENEASRNRQIGTDPQGGAEKIENGP